MLVSVRDSKTGEVILHDIFISGKWVGSRRTIRQCIDTLTYLEWPSAVIGSSVIAYEGYSEGLSD
jgi:hypothetical protein